MEAENSKYVLFPIIAVLTFLVLWQSLNLKYLLVPVKIRKLNTQCFNSIDNYDRHLRNELI